MNFGRGHRVLNFKKKPSEDKSLIGETEMVWNEEEAEMKTKSAGFNSDKNMMNKEADK